MICTLTSDYTHPAAQIDRRTLSGGISKPTKNNRYTISFIRNILQIGRQLIGIRKIFMQSLQYIVFISLVLVVFLGCSVPKHSTLDQPDTFDHKLYLDYTEKNQAPADYTPPALRSYSEPYLHRGEIIMTREARRNKVNGRVILKLFVDEMGNLKHAHVADSLGYGLDESSLSAVNYQSEFIPARLDGKPVKSTLRVPVVYKNIYKLPQDSPKPYRN